MSVTKQKEGTVTFVSPDGEKHIFPYSKYNEMMGLGVPTTDSGIPDLPPDMRGTPQLPTYSEDGMIAQQVPAALQPQYGQYYATNRPTENAGLLSQMGTSPEMIKQAQTFQSQPIGDKATEAYNEGLNLVSQGRWTLDRFNTWYKSRFGEEKYKEQLGVKEDITGNVVKDDSSKTGFSYVDKRGNIIAKNAPMPSVYKPEKAGIDFGDKELIKKTIIEMPKLKKEAISGQNTVTQIDKAMDFINKGVTGKGGQVKSWLAPYAEMVGYGGENLSDAQAFQLLTRAIIGPMRLEIVGPGPVSEWEQKLMQSIGGGGGAAKQASTQLLSHWKKLANAKIENYNDTLTGLNDVYPNISKVYKPIKQTQKTIEQTPPMQGAKKAPDGNWYIQIDGQWNLIGE